MSIGSRTKSNHKSVEPVSHLLAEVFQKVHNEFVMSDPCEFIIHADIYKIQILKCAVNCRVEGSWVPLPIDHSAPAVSKHAKQYTSNKRSQKRSRN
jgi:hypothetical protein